MNLLHRSGGILATLAVAIGVPLSAQSQSKPTPKPDRAAAYYNYSMGHLYAELAAAYGNRGEYLNKAIEHYRSAMQADPSATFLTEELAELYISAGQIRTAVSEAEDALKANPDDLGARRILGRIYMRMLGDNSQRGGINESMLKKAIEQFEKVAEKSPNDIDTLLMLGRLHKIAQNSPESEKAYKKVLSIEADNEDANIGLAMVYQDLGDSKGASELLERAARKTPNLRTLTTLASNYEQLRDFKLAAETLRRALELSPGNPDLRRAFAQNLLFSDQTKEALGVYKELVEDDARDTQSWLRLSQIYRQEHDYTKAKEALDKAKALEPNNLEIRYNEVSLLESEGRMAEAIGAMKEIVDSTTKRNYSQADKANRVLLLERLGLLYRANDQTADAVATFRQMVELDGETAARASAQIVETYRATKDFKKATEEAEAAYAKYPGDRTLKLVRANLLAEVGRGAEAAKEVRSLLDGRGDREIYLSLAQIYEKAKNYPEMAKAIDEAEKLSTSEEEKDGLVFMRAAMFEKMKNFDAAEANFRKLLAKNPDNSSALNYLGYMLADRNVRVPEALQMIQKALEKDPNNGAYLDSLGWALYRLDRLPEAEKALLRAVEKAPKDPTVHDHLGDLYQKQGRWKEAIAQWERALMEWKTAAPSESDPAEIAKVQKKLDGGKVRLAQEPAKPAAKP